MWRQGSMGVSMKREAFGQDLGVPYLVGAWKP